MKQEDLFKKIGLILIEINSQYEFLAQNPNELNELELSLFHANADFLADHAKILIKISGNKPALALNEVNTGSAIGAEDQVAMETDVQEKVSFVSAPVNEEVVDISGREEFEIDESEANFEVFKLDPEPSTFEFILSNQVKSADINSEELGSNSILNDVDVNTGKFDFEEKTVDELYNRPFSQEEENILAQKKRLNGLDREILIENDDDEIGPEPFLVSTSEALDNAVPEIIESKPTAAPSFEPLKEAVVDSNYKPTLNDLLAGKTEKRIHETSNGVAIADLKQGINLNDKLLYIKDLFNGYNLAYAEAIELANKLPNFDAADVFFKKNYAAKYNWNEKPATVDKFYALLNQRFKA